MLLSRGTPPRPDMNRVNSPGPVSPASGTCIGAADDRSPVVSPALGVSTTGVCTCRKMRVKSPGPCGGASACGLGSAVSAFAGAGVGVGVGASAWKNRVNSAADSPGLFWTGASDTGGFFGKRSGVELPDSNSVHPDFGSCAGAPPRGLRNIDVALPSSTLSGTGSISDRSDFRFGSFIRFAIPGCTASLRNADQLGQLRAL